jgi:hypothetical protein
MYLPQELTDKIIDSVWEIDDSPSHTATRTASLVSKSWVDRSQHYLFRTVEFSGGDDKLRRWCNAVVPGPNGVSRHVHSLTIVGRGGLPISEDFLELASPYLESFSNVQVLRVLGWNVEQFSPEILARSFASFAEGVRIFQWCPRLGTTRGELSCLVRIFPLIDYFLICPGNFPTPPLSDAPVGPARKKLMLTSPFEDCYPRGGSLRFREIHMKWFPDMRLETIIEIITNNADQMEILSISGAREGRVPSVQRVLVLNRILSSNDRGERKKILFRPRKLPCTAGVVDRLAPNSGRPRVVSH